MQKKVKTFQKKVKIKKVCEKGVNFTLKNLRNYSILIICLIF